jgi:hypothetical protein
VVRRQSSELRIGTITEVKPAGEARVKVSYEIPRGSKPTKNSVWRREGQFVRVAQPVSDAPA